MPRDNGGRLLATAGAMTAQSPFTAVSPAPGTKAGTAAGTAIGERRAGLCAEVWSGYESTCS